MTNKNKYKTFLLAALMVFLLLPLLQGLFRFKYEKPLKGAYWEKPDTTFTAGGWFSGRFQEIKDDYLNQKFGFRPYYVRLNNQIDYKLFRKANVEKVVIGKGDFLYESNYIEAYYGLNCIGEEKLTEKLKKLKTLQDLLKEEGVVLEVVFAPGKGSFYPEFIPDEWKYDKKKNNYEYSVEICKKLGIDFIDFNAWFLANKNVSPYDLFPRTGIHWSNYWALLCTDSIKNHVENRATINMRDITILNVNISDSLRDPDNDIGEAMNLLKPIKPFPMPYANYIWRDKNYPVKPRALWIGDSFFWNIYYEGLTNNLFTDCKFWYYNQTVFPESETIREVAKLNMEEELGRQDVIVLLATDCNIHDIGWGFVERALEVMDADKEYRKYRRETIKKIIDNIHSNKDWFSDIERKAKENNVTVEHQVYLDALFVFKRDFDRKKSQK